MSSTRREKDDKFMVSVRRSDDGKFIANTIRTKENKFIISIVVLSNRVPPPLSTPETQPSKGSDPNSVQYLLIPIPSVLSPAMSTSSVSFTSPIKSTMAMSIRTEFALFFM